MPAVPDSRASAITFHAPASRSRSICSTQTYGAMMKSASLLPTSASTVNSPERRSISSRLTSGVERDRAVGDLDVAQAELAQPRDQPVDPPWRIASSVSVPPSTTGMPCAA